MKAAFFVLNDNTLLTPLLNELASRGITGSTIFQTNGMGRELAKSGNTLLNGLLKTLLTPELIMTSTLLFIIPQNQIENLKEGINKIVGPLDQPNSGIFFVMPLDYVEGLKY